MIETEEQYERALAIVEALFLKTDKTPLEEQLLEVWTALIENYERATFSPGACFGARRKLRIVNGI